MRHHVLPFLAVLALVTGGCADSQTATPDETESAEPSEATAGVATEIGLDEAALETVAAAAGNTVEAGTTRFTLSVGAAEDTDSEGAEAVAAEGEEDFANQLRLITFTGGTGELRAVVDETTIYVELPATEGDDWARIELDELLDDVGFGGTAGLPFLSTADNLAALQTAISGASEEGSEALDGDDTTRYLLTVDLERAAETAAGESNETFRALAETSGVTELDMTVWVDEEDLIRRVTYNLDLSQAEDVEVSTEDAEIDVEPTGEVSVTVDYFDIGEPLEIEVPDEASIVDIDEDAIRDSLNQ